MSDLLEQHSRTNIPRPVPPGPADTGRRAAPEPEPPRGPAPNGTRPPEATGRRAAPDHFTPSADGPEPPRRQAPPNDFFAPAQEGTGTRAPRPAPEDGPRRAAPNGHPAPADARRPGEGTGRRARPEPPDAPGRRAAEPPRRYPEGDPNAQRPVPPPVHPEGPRPGEHTGRRARPAAPPEAPRPDAFRHDGPRPDVPRPDAYRPDVPRPDLHRPDVPRPDASRSDVPRPDVPRPDAFRPDVPRPDMPRPDVQRPDASRSDVPRPDVPRPDAPRSDAFRPDVPRPDTPRAEVSRSDVPRPDPRRPVDGVADVPHRVGESTGRRARPEPPDGPRRPAQRPEDLDPRRAPDGGPRRRPEGVPGEPPGRRFAEDGPEPPVRPGEGTGRRPMGRPVGPADVDGPHGDGPRRLAEDAAPGRRPAGPPRPDARRPGDPRRPAGPPVDDQGVPGRPVDDQDRGSAPRRLAGGPADPRRPLGHPVDDQDRGSAPRRLAGGPGPRGLAGAPVDGIDQGGAPRRLAGGPADEPGRDPGREPGFGPRRPAGPPVDDQDRGSGPRRLADGPQVAPDAPGRRFAEDPAEQAPPIADRLGSQAPPAPVAPPSGPEPREQIDPASLTTEMEAISDDVKKRREVDHTLARFSAVHDELAEQERIRKERRQKLMPWKADHDEDATEYAAPVDVLDDDGDGPRRRGRTAKHSRIVRSVKVVSLAAAVLVFVSTGLGWGAMLYIDSKIVEVDALGSNSAAVHEAEKQLGDENFLIIGSDTRAGAKAQDGVGDTDAVQGARSDVLMLAHIPADRKRMVVVSVPRDLTVTRPACEQWDSSTGQYTGTQLEAQEGAKANTAYFDGGPRCVAKFMTELTGLEINHFISVDFNGFRGMVDAVGEVEVCVPKPMVDDELGTIFDKAGRFQVNGGKALDYVRARKVSGEQFGDYDRVTRQQKFLSALLRKALSSEILLNPGKLNGFLNAFAAATVGDNIGVNDMLTLAQSLRSLEAGRVSFVTVPHYTDEGPTLSNDDNVEMLREAETRALFQSIIDGTPLPDEKPDTSAPATGAPTPAPVGPKPGKVVDPKGVKVQVLNGDPDSTGLALYATTELEDLGYDVVITGNGETTDKTVIKYHTGGEDAAATLAASIPGAVLVADPSMGGAVQLLIGPNWDEVVRAPQAGGGAAPPDAGTPQPPKDLEVVNAAADPCA
ncbi:LCP family glycopolymer transferase [Saccharothrix sp. Mg75]|uniref:LCP family glycopolymer transferase n=1 Tax=Saccharothrix sp. Mg75 TaxID=3445357 RepID=UPI003EECB963